MLHPLSARYHDGLHAISHQASVALYEERLTIQYGEGRHRISWNYADITLVQKPKDGLAGIFGSRAHPDAELIIESLEQFRAIQSHLPKALAKWESYRLGMGIAFAVFVIGFSVFYGLPMLAKQLAPLIPTSVEQSIGEKVYTAMLNHREECTTPQGRAALLKLVHQLEPDSDKTITVIQHDLENAMAIPGGYMVLHSELVENASSPEELAGIIAHEIGHLEKHHGMEQLIRTLGTAFVADVLTGGGGTLVYGTLLVTQLKFSREHESEADQYAVDLLKEKDIPVLPMTHFFERVSKQYEIKDQKSEDEHAHGKYREWLGYLSTHPDPLNRIIEIKRQTKIQAPTARLPLLSPKEWKALQDICQIEENTQTTE